MPNLWQAKRRIDNCHRQRRDTPAMRVKGQGEYRLYSCGKPYFQPPCRGDVATGQKVFKNVKACHVVDENGRAASGPLLFWRLS